MKNFVCSFILSVLFYVLPLYAKAKEIHLLPQPKDLINMNKTLLLKKDISVYLDPRFKPNENYVRKILLEKGFNPRFVKLIPSAGIIFRVDPNLVKEKDGYKLIISDKGSKTTIQAIVNSMSGLIYSLSTIHQLITNNGDHIEVPACEIYDYPYFPWRAFMLDEARHFQGKEVVKKLLDEMVQLKMNVFHWHLTDDQGWRLEIKKYPLLTEVGSRNNFSLVNDKTTPLPIEKIPKGTKWYYTQDEIRDVVSYADERGIVIVPEIEFPGHVSASLTAYPWLGSSGKRLNKTVYGDLYDVTDPNVEQFISNVFDEVIALFPGKIVHIGGDEANYSHWKDSPEINAFMKRKNIANYMDLQIRSINRLSKYIASKGARMIGWNEITGENIRNETHVQKSESEVLAPGTIVQFWDGAVSLVNKAVEKGYDVVNSNRLFTYLDYSYETTPLEKVYSFNPVPEGLNESVKGKILGLGGQIWGEFTPNTDRLYFQVFPRIAAISECGWVEPVKKTSYENFKKRLGVLESRWKNLGYLKDQVGQY